MAERENKTAGTPGVQVLELTMDNPEDQDDLNRRLTMPSGPKNSPSAMLGRNAHDKSPAESAEKKLRTNG